MSFRELLKYYRIRENLKAGDLAKHIERSETYIRRIEGMAVTPPTFDVCQKLADKLNLSDLERHTFVKACFLDRLSEDISFYNFLSDSESTQHQPGPIDTIPQSICCYELTLFTIRSKEWITSKTEPIIHQELAEIMRSLKAPIHSIATTPSHITIQFEVSPTVSINEFITGVKSVLTTRLRERIKHIQTTPRHWESYHNVTTLAPLTSSLSKNHSTEVVCDNQSSL